MALVIPSQSLHQTPSDPTADLQAALTDFESLLSPEQKQKLDDQVQQFNQQKPTVSSVIQFITQIDSVNHEKARRNVSPRLCNFLYALQQFTNIVDTFVSSNPMVAALVWGGIKTTILIASNSMSFFDKVASMIMTIGKMCPMYQEFSHLYADSTTVQQALCEYYAIVVRLASKVVQVSQRTVISSFLSAVVFPFESEFQVFQDELAEASRMVKWQVSLAAKQAAQASARLAELESREQQHHRRFMRKIASEIRAENEALQRMRSLESARRDAKLRSKIKDQLSSINHRIPWKHAQKQRLTDTAEWFRDAQDFQAWEAHPHTATLWCTGRMGAGKTVLISNIVTYVHTVLKASDVVSFHFCRSEDPASLSARNILGTLARQMLDEYIADAQGDRLQCIHDACQSVDPEALVDLLASHLETKKTYYIIIDGLDECTQDQVVLLANGLTRLCEPLNHNIKALYSGRPELEHQFFPKKKPDYRLVLSKSIVTADIERYIDIELDDCLHEQKIKLVNPETILKIRNTLFAEHDGLLLFVRLFIEEICMLGNENAILKALVNPPGKISDLLTARYRRVQSHDLATEAMKILQYCGCTKRPLTVYELGELLSVSVSQTSLDRTCIPQNMDQIIAACCGLIYVEEEETTVHYVHHCVKHHLFNNSDIRAQRFDEVETDTHLGCLCLTYLNFNDFKRQLKKFNATSGTPIAPIAIGLSSLQRNNDNNSINKIAQKLLKARRQPHQLTVNELSDRLEDVLGEVESSRVRAELQSQPFHFLEYAQDYWIWHCSRQTEDSLMWRRFAACVSGENDLANRPWIPDSKSQVQKQPESSLSIAWALNHSHTALLWYQVLLDPCLLSSEQMQSILQHAIEIQNRHLALAIMHHKHCDNSTTMYGFYHAALRGREDFLKSFLATGANIDIYSNDVDGQTALCCAAAEGHLEVVERLLAAGADVHAGVPAKFTALYVAAREGRFGVVERLLAAGAHVNAANTVELTALYGAAAEGHLEVVERLLAAGAGANALGIMGDTALCCAAAEGHLEVVERLLAAGAEVHPVGPAEFTPLYVAAYKGHLEVVERLLVAGADVNAADPERFTALYGAAAEGHLKVVERLLAAAADVNAVNTEGFTALYVAAREGHLEVVERLLRAGADPNAVSKRLWGSTALSAAKDGGHREVVERLKLAGARK